MNSPVINFGFYFLNDGTSTTVSINFNTQPIFINSGNSLSGFQAVAKPLDFNAVTGVVNLTCDSGATIVSSTFLLGILTVTLSAAGTANTTNVVSGYLKF